MERVLQAVPDQAASDAIKSDFIARVRKQRFSDKCRQIALNVLGVIIFLVLWELSPYLVPGLDDLLFPPPSDVVVIVRDMILSGELLKHTYVSVLRAIAGFIAGSVLGVLLGVLMGRLESLNHLLDPVLQAFRSIPAIAFVPLAIIWFGLGEASKVFLIAFGAFFPVWINTMVGVKSIPVIYARSAASLGARPDQIMFRVVLPAATPFIIAGLRLATAVALVVLVAAELVGASSGLGYLISYSHLVFRVDIMFVGLITLGVLGFLTDRLFLLVMSRLFPWYGIESGR